MGTSAVDRASNFLPVRCAHRSLCRLRKGRSFVKVLLKDRQLVLVPEGSDEIEELAAWKLLHDGHVLTLDQNDGTGASITDLGVRAEVCREPINIVSTHADPAIRLISNFAATPFVLDGLYYQSVEGFWQGLKYDDEAARREIALLDGLAAKRRGDEKEYGPVVKYGGREIAIGTCFHWGLMQRAAHAKFEQNLAAREALLATGERPLEHRVRRDSRTIPGVVMADIWMKIRATLRAGTS